MKQINKTFYKKPNLGTRRRLGKYIVIFENFAHHYNDGVLKYNSLFPDDKKQTIKHHHQDAYLYMLREFNSQMSKLQESRKGYEAKDLPPLQMNNVKLSKALHKSTATVWRYLQFLTEIGIIQEKIFHGTTADYEIVFNPDFILLYDYSNPEIEPYSPYLSVITESCKVSFCKPYREYTRSINKEITDVNNSQKNSTDQKSSQNGVLRTNTKNPYKSPPNIDASWVNNARDLQKKNAKNDDEKPPERPKQLKNPTPGEISARNKEYRKYLAHVLMVYAVNHLWPGGYLWTDSSGKKRYISKAEVNRTEEYIAENWFGFQKNPKEMDTWREKVYEPAIRKAESILKNRDFKHWYVNPFKYFQKENDKGFQGVVGFLYREAEIAKKHRRHKANAKIRREAVENYLQDPTPQHFLKIFNQLKKKGLPQKYMKEFMLAAQNNAMSNGNQARINEAIPSDYKTLLKAQ